jgi:hypothetical protein
MSEFLADRRRWLEWRFGRSGSVPVGPGDLKIHRKPWGFPVFPIKYKEGVGKAMKSHGNHLFLVGKRSSIILGWWKALHIFRSKPSDVTMGLPRPQRRWPSFMRPAKCDPGGKPSTAWGSFVEVSAGSESNSVVWKKFPASQFSSECKTVFYYHPELFADGT